MYSIINNNYISTTHKNILTTGLTASCFVLGAHAIVIIFTLLDFVLNLRMPLGILQSILLLDNYLLFIICITSLLSLLSPFLARLFPYSAVSRNVSSIIGTMQLAFPPTLFLIFLSIWPSAYWDMIGILKLLLYMLPITVLYISSLVYALGETLYVQRTPNVLAMWNYKDFSSITTAIILPYYFVLGCNIFMLWPFFKMLGVI